MAKLGDLYYEILFKDNTSSGIKAIEDKLKKLNTTLSVGINASAIDASIQKALNGKSYTVNVNANVGKSTALASSNSQLSERERLMQRIYDIQSKINGGKDILKNTSISGQEKKDLQQYVKDLKSVRNNVVKARDTGGRSGYSSDSRINYKLSQAEKVYAAAKRETTKATVQKEEALKKEAEAARKAAEAARAQAKAQREVATEMRNVGSAASSLRNMLAGVFSAYAAKEFLMNIINIGGEFEKQKLALAAMFNSQARAQDLYSKLQSLAVESPFTFQELSMFTKQLAAYGIAYNNIYEDVKRLADISAGVGVPMSRIILAYGQVSTATYLRGSELKQFTEAGIPLVQGLADRYTELEGTAVRTADVFERISKRAVSFEDVRAVLHSMTDEGGKFYNMQGVLAESLSGRWANFMDSIQIMYSEIEASNKDWMKSVLMSMTTVVRNWKLVISAATPLITLYGILKAAQLATWVSGSAINQMNAKVASSSAQVVAANQAETESYRQLALAMGATNEGWLGQLNSKQQAAMFRRGQSAVLNGASSRVVMASTPGLFTGDAVKSLRHYDAVNKKMLMLRRETIKLKELFKKNTWNLASKKIGLSMQLMAAKGSLALRSLGAGFVSLVNPTTIALGVIMGVVSAITYFVNKSKDLRNAAKTSAEGMKQAYEETSKFLKDNPIEVAIKDNNPKDLRELLKTYEEELRNAPIDMSFAIAHANTIDDTAKRLEYLREELEKLNKVAQDNKDVTTNTIVSAIEGETNGWLDESVGQNVKDLEKELQDFSVEANKLETDKLKAVVKAFDADAFLESYKAVEKDEAAINRLSEALKNLKNAADIPNVSNVLIMERLADVEKIKKNAASSLQYIWYNMYGTSPTELTSATNSYNSRFVGDIFPSVRANLADLQGDVDKMTELIRSDMEQAFGAGIMERMTDEAYIHMRQILADVGNYYKLSASQQEILLGMMEQKAVASAEATWSANQLAYTKVIDFLKGKYAKEFENIDLSKGFNEGQKKMIENAIANLPIYLEGYKETFRQELNNMSSDLYLNVRVNFVQGGSTSGFSTEAQGLYNKAAKELGLDPTKKIDVDLEKNEMLSLKPKDNQSTQEYIKYLQEEWEKNNELVKTYKGLGVSTDEAKKSLEDAVRKENAVKKVLKAYSPDAYSETDKKLNKKDNSSSNKAKAAQDKAEREAVKKLRSQLTSVKNYRSEFEKVRQYFGDQGAIDQLSTSGMYEASFIPRDIRSKDDLNKYFEEKLKELKEQVGVKTDERKQLNDEIVKVLFEWKLELDKENFERAMKSFEEDLKKMNEQWTRYKAFKEVGMSSSQIEMLTFGEGKTRTTKADDLRSQIGEMLKSNGNEDTPVETVLGLDEQGMKDKFADNPQLAEQLTKMVEEYKTAAKEIQDEYDKMYTDLYDKSKNYQDKIADLARKRDEEQAAIAVGVKQYEESGGTKGISPETATRLTATSNQNYTKEKGELDMEQWRNTTAYLNFFNAVLTMTSQQAIAAANALRDQLTQKLRDGSISAKDYADEIDKINEQLKTNFSQKSNVFTLFTSGLAGLREKRLAESQARYGQASNEYGEANARFNELMKLEPSPENEAAKSAALAKMEDSEARMKKEAKTEEEINQQQSKQEKTSGVLSLMANAADSMAKLRDSIGNTMESFGVDIENNGAFQTFSTAVDVMGEAMAGIQGVAQGIMSGDIFGAAVSAITAPLNIISAFNKLHDKKLDIQIKQSEKRQKEIERAADQISNAIENSLGANAAKENALESYELLTKQGQALGISEWTTSYRTLFELLSGYKSGVSLIASYEKEAAKANAKNGTTTINWGGKTFTVDRGNKIARADAYSNSEAAQALKDEGFDKAKSISAYGAEYAGLIMQRQELESQYARESKKKHSDSGKLEDYKEQLAELNEEINQFKTNLLKELYGIDFSSWAGTLSDALTNAFAEGQDAAEAFANAVNDLMKTITNNIIKQEIIMPWLDELQEKVKDAYDMNDQSSINKVIDIIYDSAMSEGLKRVEDAEKIFDAINGRLGGALTDTSSSSTITGSAKSLTEETGSLLASYLNAIRADVSIQRELMAQLASEYLPTTNALLEGQVVQLSQIVRNTDLIAQNTAACNELVGDIRNQINSVVAVGSGGKAVRIK